MPPPSPQISVIIPAYNAARFIAESVNSVLAQTVLPAEIIVVNDGSTDDTLGQIPTHEIVRIERRPHAGISATLNHGVACARGELIAFLDADDRWMPNKLELQLAAWREHGAGHLYFGAARIFQDGTSPHPDTPVEIVNGVSKSALMLSRVDLDRVGAFPPESVSHDFVDWYARAQEAGLKPIVLPELVYERRVHDTNDGVLNRDAQRRNTFAALRQALARRRAAETSTGPGSR